VERCKKCTVCQGRYFEERPSPHLHKFPTRGNKVILPTIQTAFIITYFIEIKWTVLLQYSSWGTCQMLTVAVMRTCVFESGEYHTG
jgi:hypothetical protein